jgi:hypothetical protein
LLHVEPRTRSTLVLKETRTEHTSGLAKEFAVYSVGGLVGAVSADDALKAVLKRCAVVSDCPSEAADAVAKPAEASQAFCPTTTTSSTPSSSFDKAEEIIVACVAAFSVGWQLYKLVKDKIDRRRNASIKDVEAGEDRAAGYHTAERMVVVRERMTLRDDAFSTSSTTTNNNNNNNNINHHNHEAIEFVPAEPPHYSSYPVSYSKQ